jgi:hypothetical protein
MITVSWPLVLVWFGTVVTAFLAGIWTNRLTMNREAENRRREFRVNIRNLWSRLEAKPEGVLLGEYRKSIQDVTLHCNFVQDDIMFWKRGRLQRARAKYGSLKDEQIDPCKRPGFMRITREGQIRALDEARRLIKSTLAEIEKCA